MFCATCHVYVDEATHAKSPPIGDDESDLLEFVDVAQERDRYGDVAQERDRYGMVYRSRPSFDDATFEVVESET